MMLPRHVPDLPGQLFLFDDLGEPTRRSPTQDEILDALPNAAQTVMFKFHKGRPPVGMNWEDLKEEIICRGLKRLKNFQHGGKKTLREYAYKSCEFALRDIQRENLILERNMKSQPEHLPLLDLTA